MRQLRTRPPSRRVRGALRSARIGVSGQPKCIQTNEGGAWQNEVWADPCSERRVKLQIQGAGARSWNLGRRNVLARCIYYRPVADDRFPGNQGAPEAQWCATTLESGGGHSAYQLVFGSNPVDLFGRDIEDEHLLFAHDTSLAGNLVQQWKLRMMAQEDAFGDAANRKLRRLLANKKAFNCTNVKIRDSAASYEAANHQSAPRRRGPTEILDSGETGATV